MDVGLEGSQGRWAVPGIWKGARTASFSVLLAACLVCTEGEGPDPTLTLFPSGSLLPNLSANHLQEVENPPGLRQISPDVHALCTNIF